MRSLTINLIHLHHHTLKKRHLIEQEIGETINNSQSNLSSENKRLTGDDFVVYDFIIYSQ